MFFNFIGNTKVKYILNQNLIGITSRSSKSSISQVEFTVVWVLNQGSRRKMGVFPECFRGRAAFLPVNAPSHLPIFPQKKYQKSILTQFPFAGFYTKLKYILN
jgi:hypothetical protein